MPTVALTLEQSVAQSLADSLAAAGVHAGDTSKPEQPTHPIVLPPEVPGTPQGVTVIEMDWNHPQRTPVPMTPESIVAIHFVTGPEGSTPANDMAVLTLAEQNANNYPRQAALTTMPGSFLTNLNPYLDGSTSSTVTCQFTVKPVQAPYGYPMLAPNTHYYLNVRVRPNSAPPGQDCSMFCDLRH